MKTRINYTRELKQLYAEVLKMGEQVEKSIEDTWKMICSFDEAAAKEIIAKDDVIDQMEREIEQKCLDLVLTQTPVAGDWRRIASIMRMISDLERIGDHCSDISECALKLMHKPKIPLPSQLGKMFNQVKTMVSGTVQAFVELDLEKAHNVMKQDDIQDDYFAKTIDDLCAYMEKDPHSVRQNIDYLLIAKYLERMADHSTNLAEWVCYIVSGQLEMNSDS